MVSQLLFVSLPLADTAVSQPPKDKHALASNSSAILHGFRDGVSEIVCGRQCLRAVLLIQPSHHWRYTECDGDQSTIF